MANPTLKELSSKVFVAAGEGLNVACPIDGCGAWPTTPCNRLHEAKVGLNHRAREQLWAGWSELQRVAWTALWNEKQRTRHD